MVFSSFDFLFRFLPVFLMVYFLCPARWQNLCLLLGSLLFYLYGTWKHPLYFLLFLLSLGINYKVGAMIGTRRESSLKKRWLLFGVIWNLGWLLVFKYSPLPLPLGVSFYTFQGLAYLADIYRNDVRYERSLVNFGAHFAMFPHLTSGPITPYIEARPQLIARNVGLNRLEAGLREFTIGLGLKVLIANRLGGLWSQVGAIGYESISTPLAWLGIIAYSLQLYFDFCGYSIMAKGLGTVLGFDLPDNFAHPYLSVSMTEFWRRWHITLGAWFRDYIYIPLGGSRAGRLKTFRNLFVVWACTGIWHGASWNFVLWGMILFVLIAVEKLGLLKLFERVRPLGHLYMFFAICLTWLVFAISDLSQMKLYFSRLFPFLPQPEGVAYFAGDFLKYGKIYGLSLTLGLIFMTDLPRKLYNRYCHSFVVALGLVVIFWICVYCIKMGMDDPFMYFAF